MAASLRKDGFFGEAWVRAPLTLTVDANGTVASTSLVLDEAFKNTPDMMVSGPFPATSSDFSLTYTPGATPSIDVVATTSLTEFPSRDIQVTVFARERI